MTNQLKSQNLPASDKIGTNSGNVEIFFIGHGSLMFNMDNMNIYTDPVRSLGNYDNMPMADVILVTHEHSDHLDPDLISRLRKKGCIILCNAAAAAKVQDAGVVKAGDSRTLGDIRVEVVTAYNIMHMRTPGQPFHPKGSGVGYILNYGGKRFYVAGDTENTPEMKSLKNIDVAFLPMNLPYTMTPEMVADAAKAFKPKILYPYHYGDTDTDKLIQLLKGTDIEVRIRNLQ